MKKIVLIVFLCLALCVCFVSCNNSDNPGSSQTGVEGGSSDNTEGGNTAGPDNSQGGSQTGEGEGDNTTDPDNSQGGSQTGDEDIFVDYTKETDTPYVDISYDMSLIADLYLSIEGAWDPAKMYIDVIDGQLYINEVLFDQVTYEENVEVKYADKHMCIIPAINVEYNNGISGTEEEIELLTLMTRIAQQKNCYLLKSSVDNDFAEYIAAYHIDDVCYIVLFDEEGTVLCIYYMEIEYAEPVLTEGMKIIADSMASLGGFLDDTVSLTVVDGQIYNFGSLYKIKYRNAFKLNIEWCRENLHFWRTNETGKMADNGNPNQTPENVQKAGMNLLEKINEESGCFVIYSAEENSHYYDYAIFVIDGDYYFIDVTKVNWRNAWILNLCATERAEDNK